MDKITQAHNLYEEGYKLQKQHQPLEALTKYVEAIKVNPEFIPALLKALERLLFQIAQAHENRGELDKAITYLKFLQEINHPKPAITYYIIARVLLKRGKIEEAINNYQRGFALQAQPPEWVLSQISRILSKKEELINDYQKNINSQASYSYFLWGLAKAYSNQGCRDKAILNYKKAIKLISKESLLYEELALALQENGELEEAIHQIQKCLELAPENKKSHLYLSLAKLFYQKNAFVEAENASLEALKNLPKNNIKDEISFSNLPIELFLKTLWKAIENHDSPISRTAIQIFASRSLTKKIYQVSRVNRDFFKEIKHSVESRIDKIVNLSSSLDQQKSLELFLILSVIGYDKIKDYYLDSLSRLLSTISWPDFCLAYCGLASKEIVKPTTILNLLTQSLGTKESTEETAVIYSLLCFVLGQQEDERSVLQEFIQDKGIDLLNNQNEDNKGKINYRENLRVAVAFRLPTNDDLHKLEPLFYSTISLKDKNPKFKSKSPRVALWISGQLRGYKQAWPSIKKYIVDKLNPDIFVHTWEDIGIKEPWPAHAGRVFSGNFLKAYQEVASKYMTYDKIKQSYPTLFQKLSHQGKAELDLLKQFFGTDHVIIENENQPEFQNWSNTKKMFYKIWKCADLMTSYCNDYDLVIRTRADRPIADDSSIDWQQIVEICNNEPVIYVSKPLSSCKIHETMGLVIDDNFAVGSMKVMNLYASVYSTETQMKEKGLLGSGLGPHSPLAYRFWLNNIQVRPHPVRFSQFQNARLANEEILECLKIDFQQRKLTQVDEILLKAIQLDLGKE